MRRNEFLRDHMIGRERDSRRGGRRSMDRRGADMARRGNRRSDRRNDYRRDYREDYEYDEMYYDESMDYGDMDHEYKADLKEWIEKLKHKDKFKLSGPDIIHKAKVMGISFNDYDELEFEAVYYMLISDFGSISNDPHTYIMMAKAFLEDDDIEVSPSEKLCIYLYKIVKGE